MYYQEVTTRDQMIQGKAKLEGTVLRTVWLRESTARINNSQTDTSGLKYVQVDGPETTQTDNSEKEERAQLFADAKEFGLSPAKNITTEKLRAIVAEKQNGTNEE